MTREDYVAHRLGGLLYEAWTPSQVQAIATLACEAMDEWIRERIERAMTLPVRRDHTVAEAIAYRDGVDDVTSSVARWKNLWWEDE